MQEKLRQAHRYLRFLWREYQGDRCGLGAASLAFGTLLSLVPLLALLAWLTRPFHQELPALFQPLARFISPTPELQALVRENVTHYVDNATRLGIFGLAMFTLVAWGMLGTIEIIINDIFHISVRRAPWRRILRFWLAMVSVPVLFLGSVTLNQLLERALILGGLMEKPVASWLLADLLPFTLLCFSISLGYWVLPHMRVSYRAAMIGGVTASVLYHVVRWGFGLYLNNFAAYDRIYGILGVIPAFFIWLWLAWSVVLIGAEVTFSLHYPWDEELPP